MNIRTQNQRHEPYGSASGFHRCDSTYVSHRAGPPAPSYHLFGIAESHISSAIEDHRIRIENYTIIKQDENKEGTGVVPYVHYTLKPMVLACSNTNLGGKPGIPEHIMYSVQQGNSPLGV